MKFIIIHGSFGSPDENWIPYLQKQLTKIGQTVIVPQFPCENWDDVEKTGPGTLSKIQNVDNWLKVFEQEVLPKMSKDEKVVFVGHSIAPVFILHAVSKYNIKVDCAVFVSPFLDDIGGEYWQFKVVNNSFYQHSFDYEQLKRLIPISYSVFGDNDPYVNRSFFIDFAERIKSSLIEIKNGGHLGTKAGFKEFPLLFELCKTRLERNT